MRMILGDIGIRVAEERARRKMTQKELALRAGVSLPTIGLLETGRAAELGYLKLTRILAVVGLELRLQEATTERPTLEDLLKEESDD